MSERSDKSYSRKSRVLTKKNLFFGFILILLLFYFIFDPLESAFMPQCVFHKLTGLQCFGCGSQRMIHALLHGDFMGAFKANFFVMSLIPFFIFLGWLELNRKNKPELYRKVFSPIMIICVGTSFCLWFIVRNIIGI